MTMSEQVQRMLIVEAYKCLLRLPLESALRANIHPALPILRDEIARFDKKTPEEVQTKYEALAAT